MRNANLLAALVLSLSLGTPGGAADDAGKKGDANPKKSDQELIQGQWRAAGLKVGREEPSRETVAESRITYTFAGNTLSKTEQPKGAPAPSRVGLTFVLDPSKTPREISMTITTGKLKGSTLVGL